MKCEQHPVGPVRLCARYSRIKTGFVAVVVEIGLRSDEEEVHVNDDCGKP